MRVEDILTCIAKIREYTRNMSYEHISVDDRPVDALIRNRR